MNFVAQVLAGEALGALIRNASKQMQVEQHQSRNPGVSQLMAVGDYYRPVGEYTSSGLILLVAAVGGTLFLLNQLGKKR